MNQTKSQTYEDANTLVWHHIFVGAYQSFAFDEEKASGIDAELNRCVGEECSTCAVLFCGSL